jgi:hypothetical protein
MRVQPLQSFAVSPTVVFREMDDGAVVLDLESGVYFGLDPVGTRIWTLLSEHATPQAVCDAMIQEYEVAPDVLSADVLLLVGELQETGLVRAT